MTDDGLRPHPHRAVTRHADATPGPALTRWNELRSPLRVVWNYLWLTLARVAPSLRMRRVALRAMGVRVGARVCWGLEATADVFFPELITLGADVTVGYDAVLLAHEFLTDEHRTGEVRIEAGAMIGAKAVVLPGVTVGAGAQVAANSLVTEDVPPGTTVMGVPAAVVQRQ
ncbi:MAG: acyltransferase [Haloquadratum sp.]|nr:acyltransferase [Haloferacaceae archaeon]MDR9445024.1 acyltransferase [Haloquadratum sp.]